MENKFRTIGLLAGRSVLLLALTVAISTLSRFLFVDNMFGQEYFSERILNCWYTVFFLLIFYSLTFSLNCHNENGKDKFLEYTDRRKTVAHLKFIVSSLEFYIEIICIIILSLIFPPSFLYGFVQKSFFYGIDLTAFNLKLYTLLIILPIMIFLTFVSRIEAQKNWYRSFKTNKKGSQKEKRGKTPPIVKSIATIAVIYCGTAMVIPWLLPFFITLYNMGGPLLFLWIFIGIIVMVALVTVFFYARAIVKRAEFVKKLKKHCIDNSLYLSDIRKPYVSVFSLKNGYDFSIRKNDNEYHCKFIASVFPTSLFVFSDRGNALKQDTVRFLHIELFHFMTKFDFGYESEGKKILVFLPIPKTFFVSTNDSPPRTADVGEKVGEYTVYNSNGFLNALDRDCL